LHSTNTGFSKNQTYIGFKHTEFLVHTQDDVIMWALPAQFRILSFTLLFLYFYSKCLSYYSFSFLNQV